jgi:predicted SAM-dependent methyltransferase
MLNGVLQRACGKMRNIDAHLAGKINDWFQTMSDLSEADFRIDGARLLEIGTGTSIVFPLCFVLAGAGSVKTFDLFRLLNKGVTFRLLERLEQYVPKIAGIEGKNTASVYAHLQELGRSSDLDELLGRSGIEYFAPTDARATGLEDDSVDLVFSNSVLEHVRREVMVGLMNETFRVLRPGGITLHNVACNDHYAHFDKSISAVNYLQYGEREWKLWNNSIQYQNRMRAQEFVDVAMEAGFEVISKKTKISRGTMEALATMRIAPEFGRLSREEMAKTTIDLMGRKPAR